LEKNNSGAKCTPNFYLHTPPASGVPAFTKLHPSYHLNPSQPDYAMWQSSSFKSGQPCADTCHYPYKHISTNYTLPRHHLLHLTHETLTLISATMTDEGLTPTKDGGTCLRRLSMFRKEVH